MLPRSGAGHEAPVLERRLRGGDGAVDVRRARARERCRAPRPSRGRSTRTSRRPPASTHSPPIEVLEGRRRGGHAAILVAAQAPVGRRWSANVPGRARAAAVARSRAARSNSPSPAAPLPAVGPVAPVDDHRHARVVGVVGDELVVELGLELGRDHAVDHGLSRTSRRSETRNVRNEPAVVDRGARSTRVNDASSSSGSWPRSASRTGWPESGVTRYWYQEISQATVTTTSALTPESGTIETRGSPRLLAMPPTVRRYCEALKRSAASTIASSGSERRRRIGSLAIGASAGLASAEERRRARSASRRRSVGDRRRGRRALLDPAVLERRLLAERADVDVLVAAVRREAHGPLAHQERALADRRTRRSVLTRVTRMAPRVAVRGTPGSASRRNPCRESRLAYAGTASLSFFAVSISFCAMCVGTSS